MKSYTDLEQSKKLAKILSLKSADMIWANDNDVIVVPYDITTRENVLHDFIPCWSLAALLDILPHGKALIHDKGNLGYKCICNNIDTYFHNNPVDACVNMILKLKDLNLL